MENNYLGGIVWYLHKQQYQYYIFGVMLIVSLLIYVYVLADIVFQPPVYEDIAIKLV